MHQEHDKRKMVLANHSSVWVYSQIGKIVGLLWIDTCGWGREWQLRKSRI